VIVIDLPWESPPLRSNGRESRYPKAAIVKNIRMAGFIAGRNVMHNGHNTLRSPVRVRFVWTVTDGHRRDAGASSPTLKAALDGLVDAGLLPGDHHVIVPEESCRIERGLTAGCRIEITPDGET
jgi:crossover junction endodeoxyribonuclease RusA